MRTVAVLAVVLSAAAVVSGPGFTASEPVKETRLMMGTTVDITVEGCEPQVAKDAIGKSFAEIERLEALLSNYREASEVSRINGSSRKVVTVSPETLEVLKVALWASERTGGAFDVTVSPLVNLWGFRHHDCRKPSEDAIRKTRELVGWKKVVLDERARTVRLDGNGVEVDLGGVATGYIVDKAVEVLKDSGIRSAIVNAGGDIFCLGGSGTGKPWRIGIEHPRRTGELMGTLEARDCAVVTSGDYRNFFLEGGVRYSHIIDPQTGWPARGVASVTVVAPTAVQADALSTALVVLGAGKGLEVIKSLKGVEVVIVEEGKDGLKTSMSQGIGQILHLKK